MGAGLMAGIDGEEESGRGVGSVEGAEDEFITDACPSGLADEAGVDLFFGKISELRGDDEGGAIEQRDETDAPGGVFGRGHWQLEA